MTHDDNERLRRELDAREELLWTGKPSPEVAAGRNIGTAVAGAILLAFALFWMSTAFHVTNSSPFPDAPPVVSVQPDSPGENIPLPSDFMPDRSAPRSFSEPPGASLFPLFGLIFVAAGLYMLVSPFLGASQASETLCAVTDRRALILEGERVQSFAPRDLEQIERRDRDGDSGDVIFARRLQRGAKGRTYEEEIGFFGVPHAREAERFLRQLAENAPR